jgi:hypothetical protein
LNVSFFFAYLPTFIHLCFPDTLVPKTTDEHRCCLLPRLSHHIHPTNISPINEQHDNEQRQKIEAHVFARLEEYSRRKSFNLFPVTSFSQIRRRLKRDVKYLSKEYFVSEQKIVQWIDETLERINSHFPLLQSLIDSQDEIKQLLLTDQIFQSNQWQQSQLKRAKLLFPNTNSNEKELLLIYQKYIIEILTPNKLEDDRLPLKTKDKIDLNAEYHKAETIGREYLITLFNDYKSRQYPNINLIKEIIHLGLEQMIKRPKTDELRKASTSSNILFKTLFILKSKNAYSMSLKNLADDFMVSLNPFDLIKKNIIFYFKVLTFWSCIR